MQYTKANNKRKLQVGTWAPRKYLIQMSLVVYEIAVRFIVNKNIVNKFNASVEGIEVIEGGLVVRVLRFDMRTRPHRIYLKKIALVLREEITIVYENETAFMFIYLNYFTYYRLGDNMTITRLASWWS
jgi:hypothetical protein